MDSKTHSWRSAVKQATEHLLRNQSISDQVKEMTLNARQETGKSYYHLSALHNLFWFVSRIKTIKKSHKFLKILFYF